jgi:hypothetical protein
MAFQQPLAYKSFKCYAIKHMSVKTACQLASLDEAQGECLALAREVTLQGAVRNPSALACKVLSQLTKKRFPIRATSLT